MIRDLLGQRFGKLLVIKITNERKYKSVVWKCKCDCGNYALLSSDCLVRGKTKSCGCQRNLIRKRKPYKEASFNALFVKYKHTANKKNIPFELSDKQFKNLTSQDCHYCGIEPSQSDSNKNFNGIYIYNGIDRIDNSKGYTLNNCVPCCRNCNYAKNTLSLEEFYSWLDRLFKYQQCKEST